MARRSTSARLVGREVELADLLAAARSEDPDRSVILVAGEAGIGKTRLLAEMAQALRNESPTGQTTVVRGSCVRLAEADLPFTPILEILDELRGGAAADQIETVRASLAGIASEEGRSPQARTIRFIEIREALVAASSGGRLVIIVDDVHWADQSTLDLLLFLARRIRGTNILLVASYRSDELHRRHPLRPVIAELSRGFVRERIDLGPLDREAVVEQIGALREAPDGALIEAIVDRADGNPFFVEELVALSPGGSPLPGTLRDVLLARLAEVDDAELQVLGAGAVLSCGWDIDVLQEVVGFSPEKVLASLATAVDGGILSADEDGRTYRFRHALLEEAVHDDLLPGQRVRLHRRAAAVLQGRADAGTKVPPAELAWHLDRGGQLEEAIDAYLTTAASAFRVLAWAEGVAAFERADELLQAHDGSPSSRQRLADLVEPAARAMNWAGAENRSVALLRAWIERWRGQGDVDAAVSGLLLLSRIQNDIGDELGARASTESALQLRPPDATTPAGVDLLIGMSGREWILGRSRTALRIAEEAVAGAEHLSDPALMFRALVHRANPLIALGHLDRGSSDLDTARRLQAEHGWLDTYGYMPTNAGMAYADAGELDRARELWEEGLRMSRELGVERTWDPWNLPGVAWSAYLSGRWAEADQRVAAARSAGAPGMPTAWNELVATMLAAGRGDLEAAARSSALSAEHTAGIGGEWDTLVGVGRAAVAEAAGDPERRLAELEAALATTESIDTFVLRSRLAVDIAAASADLVAPLRPSRDARRIDDLQRRARWAAQLAADIDAGKTVPGSKSVPWSQANARLAALEAARAEGADDPDDWPRIADAFRAMGMLPRVAYLLERGAAAAMRSGLREVGAARLREAHALARSIGMNALLRRIEGLARAARIDLATADQPPTRDVESATSRKPQWGLSEREREVLALLAAGRTNGEIGARLFISTKTASVHVTHILDKLGVSSRTEAAILASQAGILG